MYRVRAQTNIVDSDFHSSFGPHHSVDALNICSFTSFTTATTVLDKKLSKTTKILKFWVSCLKRQHKRWLYGDSEGEGYTEKDNW